MDEETDSNTQQLESSLYLSLSQTETVEEPIEEEEEEASGEEKEEKEEDDDATVEEEEEKPKTKKVRALV